MVPNALNILQLSTFERWGGAEAVALNLLRSYRQRGQNAYLAVGYDSSGASEVLVINEDSRGPWYRLWRGLERQCRRLDLCEGEPHWLVKLPRWLAEPGKLADVIRGVECFRFPATYRLLELPPVRPDIVHGHNLHGGYFDLRALPWLSREIPLILTLHDSWLLSGHCAQSFDCDRWKIGCGRCPDLTIYPAVRRDATAYNWRRKRDIYLRSRLYIATPSVWLMKRVEQSMLAPAIVEARVIPNGVDLSIFKPAARRAVRNDLNIAPNALVLLFAAAGVRRSPFKDFATLRRAAARVGEQLAYSEVVLLALGESGGSERVGRTQIHFVPFQTEPAAVAKYYQAADLYLHAARADTFPLTVLEALACGTPVVATTVGGVPEQVNSLNLASTAQQVPRFEAAQATGVLVTPGDAEGMAQSILELASRAELMTELADNAARDARRRFDLNRQCEAYLDWYEAILAAERSTGLTSNPHLKDVA